MAGSYVSTCLHSGQDKSSACRNQGDGLSRGEGAVDIGITSPQYEQLTVMYHLSGSMCSLIVGLNGFTHRLPRMMSTLQRVMGQRHSRSNPMSRPITDSSRERIAEGSKKGCRPYGRDFLKADTSACSCTDNTKRTWAVGKAQLPEPRRSPRLRRARGNAGYGAK